MDAMLDESGSYIYSENNEPILLQQANINALNNYMGIHADNGISVGEKIQ